MAHISFIHGIANKPEREKLLDGWTRALAHDNGIDLGSEGVTSSMTYWADVYYESPMDDEPGYENAEFAESPDLAVKRADPEPDVSVDPSAPAAEAAWVARMSAKLNFGAAVSETVAPSKAEIGPQYERIPLPGWLKRRMMKTFLRDVHHYLFNLEFSPRLGASYQVQEEIRTRFLAALKEGAKQPGPHIVVSHSMGTVIAYDCLKRLTECPRVDGLITLGSPLGIDEIQDQLQPEWTRHDGFPSARVAGKWINIYDHLDPVVGLDPVFGNDYRRNGEPAVTDINEQNWGAWRHDVTKYLSGPQFRAHLAEMLGLR